MPANFTVNPRTGAVDYIAVQMDMLSVAAFKQGVRRGPGRGDADIQIVIPAYLCQDHFQRALPLLPGILKVRTQIIFMATLVAFLLVSNVEGGGGVRAARQLLQV